MELTHLSLFSGICGMGLAAEMAGFKTVGQCEFADFPDEILKKHWPNIPRWKDVRELTGESFREKTGGCTPTVVSGGFPCQPHSVAGKHLASDDERDLWHELFRVFRETNAKWLVGENVAGLLTSEDGRFFGRVIRDLAEMGCSAWWYCFPAYSCGAKFKGERISIVATTDSERWRCVAKEQKAKPDAKYKKMLEAWEARQNDILPYPKRIKSESSRRLEWNDDGVPRALDRLKAYGNAVNPYQFYPVYWAIAECEDLLNG